MEEHAQRLLGFDDQGAVFDTGDAIVRAVEPAYRERAERIYRHYQSRDLANAGIVRTVLVNEADFMFEHERILISYPHEWPSEMLRSAALFHLDLFQRLHRFGLDLKDGLPQNVLFKGAEPCFIDFLSLVEMAELAELDWLLALRSGESEDLRMTVLRNMFIPYFAVPLVAMGFGQFALARRMLRDQACNVGDPVPSLAQIDTSGLSRRSKLRFRWVDRSVRRVTQKPLRRAYHRLADLISGLSLPSMGGYSSYYPAKGEDFSLADDSAWLAKQRTVSRLLDDLRPSTVLDLGCNTGWYSRLSAARGASVVATDTDEASLNALFLDARRENLAITPLSLSFADLHAFTRVQQNRYEGRIIFEPAVRRLKSDMTLMLGLIHHLTLGEGMSLERIMNTLGLVTRETLVLEFVDLDDELIAGNPGYFAEINSWTREQYCEGAVIAAATPFFKLRSIEDSHPGSRRILVFDRIA